MPEEVPDGSIVITPKEFYDGVRQDISEIKASVAPIPDLKADVDDHGKRLDKLERVAWVALGVALASGIPDLARFLQ
jgi:hypothetical protein